MLKTGENSEEKPFFALFGGKERTQKKLFFYIKLNIVKLSYTALKICQQHIHTMICNYAKED